MRAKLIFAACCCIVLQASGDEPKRPKEFKTVKAFLLATAELADRGQIPDNWGSRLSHKIVEITGEKEMLLEEHAGFIVKGKGIENKTTRFILIGRPTKGLLTDRMYEMAGDYFCAIGTRKVGSKTLLVIEPDNSGAVEPEKPKKDK